jgi:hypothetical protein
MPWLLPLLAAIVGVMVLVGVGAYYIASPPPTPPTPIRIDLMSPSFAGAAASVVVGYAYPPTGPQAFLVSLSVNGTGAVAVPMPTVSGIGAGILVTPAGYPFRIDWSDSNYDGLVSSGDVFTITSTRNPPPCCLSETFSILRQADGAVVSTISFSGQPGPAVIPAVSLGSASRGTSTNVYVPVYNVDPATLPSYLRFQLVIGGVATPLTPLQPYGLASNVSVAGGTYIVAWYDYNYDNFVDAGDAFNITLVSGTWPTAGTQMGFYLEWQDGTTLASATWTA